MYTSQSSETVSLASQSQKTTLHIGESLAATLYHPDTVIWLTGDLGAGKTTFARGLGLGLKLGDVVRSPTYAVENRFGSVLLHLDLFRIEPEEAQRIIEESGEFPGVRIVEWSERAGKFPPPSIHVTFDEITATERRIGITFNDLVMPDRGVIGEWRRGVRLPDHIARHCDAVGTFAKELAEALLRRGVVSRPLAVQCAGELHDLFRFVDFAPGAAPPPPGRQDPQRRVESPDIWGELRQRYPGAHEEACAAFLGERGYAELASIVRPHGLRSLDEPGALRTTEQKLLFYADKRVRLDRVVSLDERFDDFAKRYGGGRESEQAKRWRDRTKALEEELFGKDIPDALTPGR